MTKADFVNRFFPAAIAATKGTGLFPETFVAQAALETNWGKSRHSAPDVNNFSGMKPGSSWAGKVISSGTWEIQNGQRFDYDGTGIIYPSRAIALAKGAHPQTLFRVFPSEVAGIKGWIDFLKSYDRYDAVFTANTPVKQFDELKKAGYATGTNYVTTLTSIYNGLIPFFKTVGSTVADNSGAFFFTGNSDAYGCPCNN